MPSTLVVNMVEHMAWADATAWQTVLAAPKAHDDASVHSTLHHIHVVQHIFVDAWLGRPLAARPAAEFATLAALADYGRECHDAVLTFVSALDLARMDEPFREPWTDQFEARWRSGQAAPHTLAESIAQVALHTAHHRGQVCSRLRMLGIEPPTVDFIVWLWGGRPAAAWQPQTSATGSKDASRA